MEAARETVGLSRAKSVDPTLRENSNTRRRTPISSRKRTAAEPYSDHISLCTSAIQVDSRGLAEMVYWLIPRV